MSLSWKDVGEWIVDKAPLIGGVLLGPAGATAGAMISATLGTEYKPEAVLSKLTQDPAAMAEVLKIQSEERIQLENLRVQAANNELIAAQNFFKTEVDDRKDAREMSKEVNTWVQPAITIIFIAIIGLMILSVFSGWAASTLEDAQTNLLIGSVFGYMFSELKPILSFWFGSAKSHNEQAAEFRFSVNKDSKK